MLVNLSTYKHSKIVHFADIIKYLQSNELPSDKTHARKICIQSENFVIDDNVLIHLRTNRHKRLKDIDPIIRQVCVPECQRMTLLESFHAQIAHAGVDKTFLTLRNSYYWLSMYTDTRDFVLTCETCQEIKTLPHHKKAPLYSLDAPNLFQRVHFDHFGPINVKFPPGIKPHPYKYVLVMVDSLTLNCELVPTKTTSAEEVAENLLSVWASRYGIPEFFSVTADLPTCQPWPKLFTNFVVLNI